MAIVKICDVCGESPARTIKVVIGADPDPAGGNDPVETSYTLDLCLDHAIELIHNLMAYIECEVLRDDPLLRDYHKATVERKEK